jgi:hypothetical protein
MGGDGKILLSHAQHPSRRLHVGVELGGVAPAVLAGLLQQSMEVFPDAAPLGNGRIHATACDCLRSHREAPQSGNFSTSRIAVSTPNLGAIVLLKNHAAAGTSQTGTHDLTISRDEQNQQRMLTG